jgi:hypothetical protein
MLNVRKQNDDTLEYIPFFNGGTVDIPCISVTLLLSNFFSANIHSSYHVSACNPCSVYVCLSYCGICWVNHVLHSLIIRYCKLKVCSCPPWYPGIHSTTILVSVELTKVKFVGTYNITLKFRNHENMFWRIALCSIS